MKPFVFVLLLVVAVLGGFYGGYRTGHNTVSASTNTGQNTTRTGAGGFGGGRTGGFAGAACPSPGAPSPSPGTNAVAAGAITDLTSTSFTITEPACDIKVTFGNTVQVSKNVAGSTSDLQDNLTITVIGTRQADGSIKATTIQIGAAGRGGFGNPGGGGGGAQASPSGG